MDIIYKDCCLQPQFNKNYLADTTYVKRKKGETYWSLDCFTFMTLDNYLQHFYSNYIQDCKNLAVDGPSACGKSTILCDLNCSKINNFYNLNESNNYNILPELSLSYIMINDKLSNIENLTMDRSIISNLCYLMTYYVMNTLTNKSVHTKSMHAVCNEFIYLHNLKSTLEFIRAKKYNVLILLDSSFEAMAKRTTARGIKTNSVSDLIKPLCWEYHTAQTAAFAYIANFMQYPCIDFDYLRQFYGLSDEQMFSKNKEVFERICDFKKFDKPIDIPKKKISINPTVLKCLHSRIIEISNR